MLDGTYQLPRRRNILPANRNNLPASRTQMPTGLNILPTGTNILPTGTNILLAESLEARANLAKSIESSYNQVLIRSKHSDHWGKKKTMTLRLSLAPRWGQSGIRKDRCQSFWFQSIFLHLDEDAPHGLVPP
jgi:hypothetical protein